MIALKEITIDNFRECLKLQVDESQKHFVAGNAYSLAQSKYQPECIPLAIYHGDEMVGCIDAMDGVPWLYRLIIDKTTRKKAMAGSYEDFNCPDSKGYGLPAHAHQLCP